MQLFYAPDIESSLELPAEEAAHCLRVLRLNVGDALTLTDGKGCMYDAVISAATNKRCQVKIMAVHEQAPLWKGRIHLALAPTKNMDRMEWLAEKITEIGVDEITFLQSRHSERKVLKTERIDKILVAAMKQSLKARKPILHDLTDFSKFLRMHEATRKYIAHCHDLPKNVLHRTAGEHEDSIILIGPEGDFSVEEVEQALAHGYESVSLGNSRLRTETAALVAVHTLSLHNGV